MDNKSAKNTVGLQPYLSPIAVWAFSVGSAIGWGSLIVTNTNYISQAGPLGSIIGLAEYNSETDKNIHDVFKRADALMYERKKQLKSMGAVIRE